MITELHVLTFLKNIIIIIPAFKALQLLSTMYKPLWIHWKTLGNLYLIDFWKLTREWEILERRIFSVWDTVQTATLVMVSYVFIVN